MSASGRSQPLANVGSRPEAVIRLKLSEQGKLRGRCVTRRERHIARRGTCPLPSR
jgi:hypothetical protein